MAEEQNLCDTSLQKGKSSVKNNSCAKRRVRNCLVFWLIMLILVCASVVLFNVPFAKISSFCEGGLITSSELEQVERGEIFGPFVSARVKNKTISTFGDDNKIKGEQNNSNVSLGTKKIDFEPEIEFKLFNLIPIKTQKVHLLEQNKVLVSGSAVGLVLKTNGVLVVGSSPVSTPDGERDICMDGDIKVGDTILQIENETVENVANISKIVNKEKNRGKDLNVKLVRNNKTIDVRVKPCYDIKEENYKLGIWARDDASGIGTLTYITDGNRFGSLGHPICDSDTKKQIDLKEGKLYNCSILGVNKGISGSPGEIKGLFMQGKNEQGVVEKNNNYGVFGTVSAGSNLIKACKEYEIGGRLSVKPGKAQIRCCIDGSKIECFDIEIIKTNFQNHSNDKSMVIRVTDPDLIARTGGIVQGMSGSPIIQNNKIVGAVTHVFISDPTKGFGVYIDWMLGQ
ncbi:MAG: SpoIVB peptidase [Christensenellales bacterium]